MCGDFWKVYKEAWNIVPIHVMVMAMVVKSDQSISWLPLIVAPSVWQGEKIIGHWQPKGHELSLKWAAFFISITQFEFLGSGQSLWETGQLAQCSLWKIKCKLKDWYIEQISKITDGSDGIDDDMHAVGRLWPEKLNCNYDEKSSSTSSPSSSSSSSWYLPRRAIVT